MKRSFLDRPQRIKPANQSKHSRELSLEEDLTKSSVCDSPDPAVKTTNTYGFHGLPTIYSMFMRIQSGN